MNPDDTIDMTRPEAARLVGVQLESTALSTVDRMRGSLVITDRASLEQVAEDRTVIYGLIKQAEEFFKPLKNLAHQLHANLCAREAEILGPLRAVDREQAEAIRLFHAAEERERRERERAIAEARRVEDEARAAAAAAEYERAGEHATAAAVLAEAIAAPPPVVVLPDPNRDLVSFTRRWKWRYAGGPSDVTKTPPEIIRRTLAILPEEFKMADEKKIGAYARSMKSSGRIAGIEIFATDEPNH